MIGASRDTVTRLFSDFKKKQFLQVKGSTVIIKNKAGLENPVGASPAPHLLPACRKSELVISCFHFVITGRANNDRRVS